MKRIIRKAIAVLDTSERKALSKLVFANAVISITDIGSLALLIVLIRHYSQVAQGKVSFLDGFISRLNSFHFLVPLSLLLFLFIIKNVAAFFVMKKQYDFTYRVAARISSSNVMRYLNGSFHDYSQVNSATHISAISYQPTEFSTYILGGMQQVFTEAILLATAIAAILVYNAKLFLLLLLLLVPPVLLVNYLSRKRLNLARANVKSSAELATQYLNEALDSYVESNVYGKKGFFVGRFRIGQSKLTQTLSQLAITQFMPSRFIEVFAVFGFLILIVLNQFLGKQAMELVNIGVFVAAAYKIIPGITRIATVRAQMRMYEHTIDNVGKELILQTDQSLSKEISSLHFENVMFRYFDRDRCIHINLEAVSGDFVGISSESGKGKTTMVNLLLGLLEPMGGAISINGKQQGAADLKAYWPRISYVKQQPFLIHDTILRNITIEDHSSMSDRLQQAIHLAGLEQFIESHAQELDYVVTHNGKNISGGQRQRIALARALYKDFDLLILDEPFSEMDAHSEQKILEGLQQLRAKGKMVLLITHNKESLRFCNKVASIF